MERICHNCKGAKNHTAMYCDVEPQQVLRCEQCSCCCRNIEDHAPYCSRIEPIGRNLDRNDPLHTITERLYIETTGSTFKIVHFDRFVDSTIESISIDTDYTRLCDWISYRFVRQDSIVVKGPRTMYYRIFIVTSKCVLFRIDVLRWNFNVTIINMKVRYFDRNKIKQINIFNFNLILIFYFRSMTSRNGDHQVHIKFWLF